MKDAWRVVSNYTKDDIDNYYADVSVSSSGVQKYEWDEGVLNNTRHLDFAAEKHKILETELKMLCKFGRSSNRALTFCIEYAHAFSIRLSKILQLHELA